MLFCFCGTDSQTVDLAFTNCHDLLTSCVIRLGEPAPACGAAERGAGKEGRGGSAGLVGCPRFSHMGGVMGGAAERRAACGRKKQNKKHMSPVFYLRFRVFLATLTTTTPRLARTSAGAGAPGVQGPLERGSCGFNAARGRCSGQLCSK
jgi:hypothetical protein